MQIEVLADDNSAGPPPGASMSEAAGKAMELLGSEFGGPSGGGASGRIRIVLVDDAAIRRLNAQHLNKDVPTDVLAFDYRGDTDEGLETDRETPLVAEVFVSTQTASEASRTFATSWDYEIMLYIVHGLLHLCGYRDDSGAAEKQMRERESELMSALKPWLARGFF